MRSKVPAAVAAAGILAVTLAGCASGDSKSNGSSATPQPSKSEAQWDKKCVSAGDASKSIQVSGNLGEQPEVKGPDGIKVDSIQKSVVTPTNGRKVTPDAPITLAMGLFDLQGKEVAPYQAYNVNGQEGFSVLSLDSSQLLSWIKQAVNCSNDGSRIVATIPSQTDSQGKQTSYILVADVHAYPSRADGAEQPKPNGMPAVTLAKSGEPTIAKPSGTAPLTLQVAKLKAGTGATVKDGDSVVVQYRGITWADGKTFDSSWSRGLPASFSVDQVVPGFKGALLGQQVGSQVIAVIPPDQGYGDKAQSNIPAGSTLVFVIDILGVDNAPQLSE